MTKEFKVGHDVTWNSEAGHVSGGIIIKMHRTDVAYEDYAHHASKDKPQYEIKSIRTAHIAMHNSSVLEKT